MAYASWSVVFGEQPSATKWNILGTNDASFNDGTGIANGAITTAHIADDAITSEKLDLTIGCRAYRTNAVNLTSTPTIVAWDTESYDIGSDHSTANGLFTVPETGYYEVNGCLGVSNLDAGGNIFAEIWLDGAIYSRGSRVYSTNSADDPAAMVTDIVPATAAQTLGIAGFSSTTEALVVGANQSYMSIAYLGK